jgi:hypothetical protein
MITHADNRLGRNGAEEIKAHPFFEGFDWTTVRQCKAPYQPCVKNEISNENFDKFDEEDPFFQDAKKKKGERKIDMNFIGFTYKGDVQSEKNKLVAVLKDLDSITESQVEEKEEETKIQNVKVQNQGNMSHREHATSRNLSKEPS